MPVNHVPLEGESKNLQNGSAQPQMQTPDGTVQKTPALTVKQLTETEMANHTPEVDHLAQPLKLLLLTILLSSRVRRSSPRTAKRPRTELDQTDLGPVLGPGPKLFQKGLGLDWTRLLPLFNRGSN